MMIPLEPLIYYRLKASLLEITLQEQQIAQVKHAAFTAAGLPPGPYAFHDTQHSVELVLPAKSATMVEVPE